MTIQYSSKRRDSFAALSGDLNSIHFGEKAIAYGMDVLSIAVARVVQDGDRIVKLEADFRKPIPVGSDIEFRVLDSGGLRNRLGVYLDNELAVSITLVIVPREWCV